MKFNYINQLNTFKSEGRFRSIPSFNENASIINLSSNDYLGLAASRCLQEEFLDGLSHHDHLFSASSARLLTGNFEAHEQLESALEKLYKKPALIFNSGYHANTGILAALADKHTLILADKLVHASMIDGIQLSAATCIRYRHNDYEQLEHLIELHKNDFERIIVATESIFSMNGDEADLRRLTALKKHHANVLLYVDEAHAVGVRGKNGLGCAEESDCLGDVDVLVATFGKALASVGAYVICHAVMRDYLINTARSFIFSTALPPVNALWSVFILERLSGFGEKRQRLESVSNSFRTLLGNKGNADISTSHIVPYIVGESIDAVNLSECLKRKGFYVLPVRPPTVPKNTARLRFSFTADVKNEDVATLISELMRQQNNYCLVKD